jgi:predicted CoA-binding protein
MARISEAALEFLSHKRIAVAGVSRRPAGHGANVVYRRLRDRGYEVFAVNPNTDLVEGDRCYHDIRSIPGGVDCVVIATPPDAAESVARECRELGIDRVWMHRLYGSGSVSEAAMAYCRDNGMTAIAGGCPLMFGPTSDVGHVCMRWFLNLTGGSPKTIP